MRRRQRHVREVLLDVARRGITLRCGREEDRLHASPRSAVTPELLEELKDHKAEIIKAMREDEELRRTNILQSERQVYDEFAARMQARELEKGEGGMKCPN